MINDTTKVLNKAHQSIKDFTLINSSSHLFLQHEKNTNIKRILNLIYSSKVDY